MMRKSFTSYMLIAAMLGLIAAVPAAAADEAAGADTDTDAASSSVIIDRSDNVSLLADHAAEEGITAVRMSLQVAPERASAAIDQVVFEFAESNHAKITEYRYHEETGQLNIYVADAVPLFKTDVMKLGTIKACDAQGEEVPVSITVPEQALTMLTKDELKTEAPAVSNRNIQISENSMEISRAYATSYQIVIPSGSDKMEAGDEFIVRAENILLEHGQTLEVAVTSENKWHLTDSLHPENPEQVRYLMGFDDGTQLERKTETILSVTGGRTADSVTLTILEVNEPEVAGTFADTLTFTSQIG